METPAKPAREVEEGATASSAPPDIDELPGDSVCWLRFVCPECGAMTEGDPTQNCPQCGAAREADR